MIEMRDYLVRLDTDIPNGPTRINCGKVTARNAAHAFEIAMHTHAARMGIAHHVEKAHAWELTKKESSK